MAVEARKTKAEQDFADQFGEVKDALPGDAWVAALRQQAWDAYAALGLPNRRVEEWKYTDLRTLLKEAYPPPPAVAEALTGEDVDSALGRHLASVDSYRLVVADGKLRPELSDMDALAGSGEILSLSEALAAPPSWLKETLGQVNPPEDDAIVALNTALMSGGVAVRLSDGVTLDKPLHIIDVHAGRNPSGLTTRNVISVGAGASLTLLESYVSRFGAPAQCNSVTELIAGDGAQVRHKKLQNEGPETTHLTTWMTRLGADVDYRVFQFSAGASVARNQIYVRFAGEDSLSHINGAVLARGKQHNDTTMVVDHAVPGCESREFNKLVLDDNARGIVQCRVNVFPDAQKTDGHQMAHGLLLSEATEFDSKPELEIFADDVVCGHGSTSGQVNEEYLFYLRSRGIPEARARSMLVAAFTAEAIERIDNEEIASAFLAMSEEWLAAWEGA